MHNLLPLLFSFVWAILITFALTAHLRKKLKRSQELLRRSFKGTVLSLTAKEIVQAMIDGLKHQWVKVNMSTYGACNPRTNQCFGCAATNTICELIQKSLPPTVIEDYGDRASFLYVDSEFLTEFESAVNYLRQGSLTHYNRKAKELGIATIPNDIVERYYDLPKLNTGSWKEHLHSYQELADKL